LPKTLPFFEKIIRTFKVKKYALQKFFFGVHQLADFVSKLPDFDKSVKGKAQNLQKREFIHNK